MLTRKELYERWKLFMANAKAGEYQAYEDFVADYEDEYYHRLEGEN